MADFQLVMPKMGESIMEATILKWHKKEGDHVEMDETILEIATDKVDSEIPSPVSGTIKRVLFDENDVVEVGATVAHIQTSEVEEEQKAPTEPSRPLVSVQEIRETAKSTALPVNGEHLVGHRSAQMKFPPVDQGRFYSPLVRKIAQEEGLSLAQLNNIPGSGLQGRVTKRDILTYIQDSKVTHEQVTTPGDEPVREPIREKPATSEPVMSRSLSGEDEIVQMDRLRKIIAEHMVTSKKVAPHVTSFVEADVTNLVKWRESQKDGFYEHYGTKLTLTPIFIHAIVKAITDFPMVNISVNGDQLIVKKNINIGMATALPSGNLIVPVIKNADDYSLVGLAKKVNDLAERARKNELKPDEVTGGTFTLTNVGIFGNVMGTPIINQPQVAILATGAIKKKPAVVETEYGDLIAIRQLMFLSMSYDHRVVDGFLGGSFLRKVADYLEQFSHDDLI